MSEPINERSIPAIAPTGILSASASPSPACACIASSKSSLIAPANPPASGSTMFCQPGRVALIQSIRLSALLLGSVDAREKKVASSNQSSAMESASWICATSFAPMGEEPCACTNFLAVSATIFLGSASVVAPSLAAPCVN